MNQNVTLSLPAELVKEARHIAVDQGVSLSKFLASLIEAQVETARTNRQARERFLQRLEAGFDLGVGDHISWKRDDLHER